MFWYRTFALLMFGAALMSLHQAWTVLTASKLSDSAACRTLCNVITWHLGETAARVAQAGLFLFFAAVGVAVGVVTWTYRQAANRSDNPTVSAFVREFARTAEGRLVLWSGTFNALVGAIGLALQTPFQKDAALFLLWPLFQFVHAVRVTHGTYSWSRLSAHIELVVVAALPLAFTAWRNLV